MRESIIEAEGVKYAKARGWEVFKWGSPGHVGVHDQLHFNECLAFAIEYKTTGKKATPKQRECAAKLKSKGIPCRCCDDLQDARDFIDSMTEIADSDDPIFDVLMLSSDISSFDP